jgi:cephalosporin hydroxylase
MYKFESEKILGLIKEIQETKICNTDKGSDHTYTGMYEEILSQYKDKDCTLLEIGVQSGGSALLWSKYLPNAKLSFSDIDQLNQTVINMIGDKCIFHLGDAYSDYGLNAIKNARPEGFDIVIDDGPHTLQSMIQCIRRYLPIVKINGYLIIEDIQNISWCDILKNEVPLEYRESIQIFDVREFKNRYDDIAFIINKRINN